MKRIALACAVAVAVVACTADDDTGLFGVGGQGGTGGSLSGGKGGSKNVDPEGGSGGSEGDAGTGGSGAKGGGSSKGGTGGVDGDAGEGGSDGDAGEGGSDGDSGTGGKGGATGGKGGASGKGGTGGAGGKGGAAGAGAKGGTGGSGGGTSGTGGTGGGPAGTGGSPAFEDELTLALCTDGLDNDQNGFTDCADNSCRDLFTQCQEKTDTACADGLDNDADGFTDCKDTGCKGRAPCLENTQARCTDGIDNDDDSYFDCDDFDCQNKPAIPSCYVEPSECTDAYEPNDEPGDATILLAQQGKGQQCLTLTICAKDTDHIRVYFSNAQTGGAFSLTAELLSPPLGTTTTVTSIDYSNKEPTVGKQLKSTGTPANLTETGAVSCSNGACPEEQRKLTVSSNSSGPLTYKICANFP